MPTLASPSCGVKVVSVSLRRALGLLRRCSQVYVPVAGLWDVVRVSKKRAARLLRRAGQDGITTVDVGSFEGALYLVRFAS